MGHFYFVRHGQTVWNVENKICGTTDSPLTEYGREQARETGRRIMAEGIKADEILYSPLSRAADTARLISEMTGIPCREEPRLIEQNFGKWESTPRDGLDFKKAKEYFACSHEGGESTLRLAQRIYNLLDDIKAESDQKTYILVAHNGIARVVQSYFTDMTNEEYAAWGVKNCDVIRYDFVTVRIYNKGERLILRKPFAYCYHRRADLQTFPIVSILPKPFQQRKETVRKSL